MPIKDIVVSFLKEKQSQLMEQYAEWEDLQGEFPEDCSLCQNEMDRVDRICESIRKEIYELEGFRNERNQIQSIKRRAKRICRRLEW